MTDTDDIIAYWAIGSLITDKLIEDGNYYPVIEDPILSNLFVGWYVCTWLLSVSTPI
jgi:hypothetical protein